MLAAAALSGAMAAPAAGQDGSEGNRKIGDWSLSCRPSESRSGACSLSQNIIFRQSGKRVLSISVSRVRADRPRASYVVSITAPLGILLPAGLTLVIDDRELVRFPLRICNVNGCQGTFPFTEDVKERFIAAESGQVMFRQPNGRPLRVQFSLRGFGPAFEALSAQ